MSVYNAPVKFLSADFSFLKRDGWNRGKWCVNRASSRIRSLTSNGGGRSRVLAVRGPDRYPPGSRADRQMIMIVSSDNFAFSGEECARPGMSNSPRLRVPLFHTKDALICSYAAQENVNRTK
jgi:hypothetical protein